MGSVMGYALQSYLVVPKLSWTSVDQVCLSLKAWSTEVHPGEPETVVKLRLCSQPQKQPSPSFPLVGEVVGSTGDSEYDSGVRQVSLNSASQLHLPGHTKITPLISTETRLTHWGGELVRKVKCRAGAKI